MGGTIVGIISWFTILFSTDPPPPLRQVSGSHPMVLPPILFWNVASFYGHQIWFCRLALRVHHLHVTNKIFPLFLWHWSFTPTLLLPLLPHLPPIPLLLLTLILRVLMVEVRAFIFYKSVVVYSVEFTIFCICSCI